MPAGLSHGPPDMTIKRGDRRSYIRMQLVERGTRTPVDLTGATAVYFYFGFKSSVPGTQGTCQIIDAVNGIVEYKWADGDLDTAGQLLGEVKVIWPVGEPQTYPSFRYLHVEVLDDLS